jgi:hypothetical protein
MTAKIDPAGAEAEYLSVLAANWFEAVHRLEIRHPNGRSKPILRVIDGDPPQLYVGLDETMCTLTGAVKRDFAISTVKLAFWPGMRLAHMWLAAAWAGYCQHEALELVTLAGDRASKPLDPHAEPYETNPCNRGLRDGFPVELTLDTMVETLALVMPRDDAHALVRP